MTTHTYDTLRYPPHHNTTTKYTHNACYAICRYPQGLGVKSTLYTKFMKEEVDLERECARSGGDPLLPPKGRDVSILL
jgi:hypothetical protein